MMNLYSDSIQIDPSISLGKNRVRSMVNQLNAAVSSSSSSSRPTIPSTIPVKRIPTNTTTSSVVNSRRQVLVEPTTNSTTSTNKTTIVSPNRPSLQRAMTINHQSFITPSPPSTPPTITNNNNNNVSSTYKRK
jgi:hypothetical protein